MKYPKDAKWEMQFKLFDSGVVEVAEGWDDEIKQAYEDWRHGHIFEVQDDGSCYCVICGMDGNA